MLQIGFTDKIDPALSLKLISQSSLAFLNRHLPLTSKQRKMFSSASDETLAVSSARLSNAQQQQKHRQTDPHSTDRQSKTEPLQPGNVVLNECSDGLARADDLAGRAFESRVLPEERQVFERICKGHVAILELSL